MENALPGTDAWEALESPAWFGSGGSQPSQRQAVLKLPFSEDQRFSGTSDGEVNVAGGNLPDAESRERYLASWIVEDQDRRPEVKGSEPERGSDEPVKEQSTFTAEPGNMVSCEGRVEGPQRAGPAPFPGKPGPDAVGGDTREQAICQQTTLGLVVISKSADRNPEKPLLCSVEQSQPGELAFKANVVKAGAETVEDVGADGPQHSAEAPGADQDVAPMDQWPAGERQESAEEEAKARAEIGERSKTVAFLREPEVPGESTLAGSLTPMESTGRVSGESEETVSV